MPKQHARAPCTWLSRAILAEGSRLNSKALNRKVRKEELAKGAKKGPFASLADFFAADFFVNFAVKIFSCDKIPALLFQAYADHDCIAARD